MSLIRKQDQVIRMQGVDNTGTAVGDPFTPEVISFTASPVQSANVREFVAGTQHNNLRKRTVYDTHYEFDGTVEANPQTILAYCYWAMNCSSIVHTYDTVRETHAAGVNTIGGTAGMHLLEITVYEEGNKQILNSCVFTSMSIEASSDGDDRTAVINFSGIAKNLFTEKAVNTSLISATNAASITITVADASNILVGDTLTITNGISTITRIVASVDYSTNFVDFTQNVGTVFAVGSSVSLDREWNYNPLKMVSGDGTPVLATPYTAKHIILLSDHTDDGSLNDLNTLNPLVTQMTMEFERPVGIHYIAGYQSHSGIEFVPENMSFRCVVTAAYTEDRYNQMKELYDNNSVFHLRSAFTHTDTANAFYNFYCDYRRGSVTELTPLADVATEGIREFSFTVEHFWEAFGCASNSHSQAFPYQKNPLAN